MKVGIVGGRKGEDEEDEDEDEHDDDNDGDNNDDNDDDDGVDKGLSISKDLVQRFVIIFEETVTQLRTISNLITGSGQTDEGYLVLFFLFFLFFS